VNTDEKYVAANDALFEEGLLVRGFGREGSIMRLISNEVDEGDEEAWNGDGGDEKDGFELTSIDAPAPQVRKSAGRKTASKKMDGPKQVLSYHHGETRVNNPEVGMVHVGTDPDGVKTTWAYDPHLDPVLNFDSARAGVERLIDDALASGDAQAMKDALLELKRMQAPYLTWTGKAERTSFQVDTVSLHVHERVDPAAILAAAARRLKGNDAPAQWRQPDLFAAPFENLPLRQALDFYHHEKGWSNRLVSGDSLLVMNSLLTKESMGGKVHMIFIDPPYGIKYGSNFQPFTNKRDVKDRSDEDLTQEPEMIKAFRDTWELGIHSYLTYLRDRLVLARDLLHETGSVFVQIGDENLHRATNLCDEVFGVENQVSIITFIKTSGQSSELLSGVSDYLIWYAKSKPKLKFRQPLLEKSSYMEGSGEYVWLRESSGKERMLTPEERRDFESVSGKGKIFRHGPTTSQRPPGDFPVTIFGKEARPGRGFWKTHEVGIRRLAHADRLVSSGSILKYKRFIDDYPVVPISNNWSDTATGGSSSDPRAYVVQTVPRVVERCILMTTDPGDLVLDPTCGSGTTAFAAEKWGRRWITCDTSRIAVTLAKQRLMTSSFDYFALRYPHEGLKGGFDYETVPHIMLKSVANNPDIDTIHAEDHPKITAALTALNAASPPPRRIPSARPKGCARASRSVLTMARPCTSGRCPSTGHWTRTTSPSGPPPPVRPLMPFTTHARRCSAGWMRAFRPMPNRKPCMTSPASTGTACASLARSASRLCPRPRFCRSTTACRRQRPTTASPAPGKPHANRSGATSC
jgi:adenine-specific DNA-methyltransferase